MTANLRRAAVLLFIVCSAFAARAQAGSAGEELSYRRLQQAAEAIGEGQLPRAEALLDSVLASSPRDADALNLLGVVRARQRRAADAESLFRRALAAQPAHVGAHVNLGELYLTTGRPEQALQILLAAHKLAPERPDVNLKLAALYEGGREYETALEHLKLVPPADAGADYFPLLLKALLGLRRLEEARRLAAEFKGSGAGDAEGAADFALLLAGGGLSDEALELLEAARARSPESFPVLYALGVVNAAAKRYAKAEEYLTAALRAKPDDVATLRALASVARATGDLEKALAHLIRARRVAPDSPAVLYDFGVTALKMDLLLDALPAFEQLYRARPQEPAYIYALAAARLKKGDRAEAVRLMKVYTGLRPQDAAGFYLLGAALRSLSQLAEARAALERSVSLKPDPDAEYLLGDTLNEEGNRAAAIETLRRVVGARPDHAAAHAALGAAYREQGDYARARAELERAVELDPKDLRANYQLGLVYAKLGDKEAAKRMLEAADALRAQQRQQESVVLKLAEPPQN